MLYVDNRFLSYTPTQQMNLQFDSLYTRKSDPQSTNNRMLTLLRNMSQTTVPDPFAFLYYYVTFLPRETLVLSYNKTVSYHFDPVASWSFKPALTYLETVVSSLIQLETTWNIGVMSMPDLIACGFMIQ
jgi:hypothetical protein